ncbi:MAG: hypothetical protein AMXMBFR61_15210 [Fimbriimonadales bacterium]
MSSSWGINRTMAQIHALLYITGEQMTMDEIIERLRISRGNASMNLRELMAWGMVHRYKRPGDRKDVYFSEANVWHMFSRVVRERKRREVDPTVTALRDCLALVRDEPKSAASQTYETRVRNLLDVFALLDTLFRTVITDDDALRAAVEQGAALHGVRTPQSSE